ncbi:PD-(D/E)XK nuclease superfamily protein [Desulfosporosinus acididurans]|uniref:PD-(D/E)XK nuclease superfamily protein n=1 Tax=Desulfosporosinus acididurans TaxID=476652 RepID=A0A0J1FQX9_9FIRM|nr:DUF2800 domain-containing protein [Desulfosporosinus acididurans]KLU65697.1 PD-(D/E)XK nuclease superfamily protein [Desulfosporosinus acididurans]
MPSTHALLSASSSHRWLNCTPSARIEEALENRSSFYANEGTAAHALSEHKLREFLKLPTQRPTSDFDSTELNYYTDRYVEHVCELISEAYTRCNDPRVLIEQRLDYSHVVPQGFGTGDTVIVSDQILDVLDLKYGMVRVSAEDNPQLKLYALGALDMYGFFYDVQTVRLTICQPRLDSISVFELSVAELTQWAEIELKPKADLAFRGEGEFAAGGHCRFCRARATCRARAEKNLELAKMDFKAPAMLSDEEIAEILTKAEDLAAWAKDVWVYAEKEAISHDKQWTGYKLVEGTRKRKYTNEGKIAEVVLATGQYNESQIYTKNLISLTAMEQLLGKKTFAEVLDGLWEKPPGKPKLVPKSHKKPEWNRNQQAKKDFED